MTVSFADVPNRMLDIGSDASGSDASISMYRVSSDTLSKSPVHTSITDCALGNFAAGGGGQIGSLRLVFVGIDAKTVADDAFN